MKTLHDYLAAAIALLVCIVLVACTPIPKTWQGKPNPLDQIAVPANEPTANGYWGPFGTAPLEHRNFSGSP